MRLPMLQVTAIIALSERLRKQPREARNHGTIADLRLATLYLRALAALKIVEEVETETDHERRPLVLLAASTKRIRCPGVCRRDGRVRLFTRRGYDWTDRYPLVGATAEALTQDATIDGEHVVCDGAGIADFERLHSREHDRVAFLYAFDLLELDGVDVRPLALVERKGRLRQLLQGMPSRHPV